MKNHREIEDFCIYKCFQIKFKNNNIALVVLRELKNVIKMTKICESLIEKYLKVVVLHVGLLDLLS